jgi:signal peptidase I
MSPLQIPVAHPTPVRPARRLGGRRAFRIASSVVAVAAVVAWALLLRPQFLGGPAAYVMVAGISMEPTFHNGDLVVARRRDSYRVGDVVVYRVPRGEAGAGSLIIHRIVGGSEAAGWIVQGDNRDVPDLWRPRSGDIVGAMWADVPGAGTLVARGASPLALASICTLFALFLGLPAGVVRAVDGRSRRRPLPPIETDLDQVSSR